MRARHLTRSLKKKRLEENAALGKKPNEGATPTISKGGKVLGVF